MATLVSDNFDASSTGSLDPSWTQATAGVWTVEDGTGVGLSGRAHRAAQGAADDYATRTFTRQTSANGLLTIAGTHKSGSTVATSSNRWGRTYVFDGATEVTGITLIGPNITLLNSLGGTNIVSITTNILYAWSMVLNFTTGKITQAVVNGTTFNNGGAGWSFFNSVTGVDQIKTSRFSPTVTGGEFVWADDYSVTNTSTGLVIPRRADRGLLMRAGR